MSKKWLWLTIGAVAVAFIAGAVVAQEGLKYPYLPAEYSKLYIPTRAEWEVVCLTAVQNYEGALSDKLRQTHVAVRAMPTSGLVLLVDTKPQPGWNVYRGNGRWNCSDRELRAAYEEAADSTSALSIMPMVRSFFPGIANKDVEIQFFVNGGSVGAWTDGVMTLAGDE